VTGAVVGAVVGAASPQADKSRLAIMKIAINIVTLVFIFSLLCYFYYLFQIL
jgi:hypothetical protein